MFFDWQPSTNSCSIYHNNFSGNGTLYDGSFGGYAPNTSNLVNYNYAVIVGGNVPSTTSFVNSGASGIRYFDIDMTRNDIGIYGGPYSWDNYWGSSTGKGVIYDLDMPFEYWTGQSATINAKAAHVK